MKTINEAIINSINNSTPHSSGKMGSIEADALAHYYSNRIARNWDTPAHNKTLRLALTENAGVFPDHDLVLDKWCKTYLTSVKNLDDIIMWCPEYGDESIIKAFCKDSKIHGPEWDSMDHMNFEGHPSAFELPKEKNWFKNLSGKKVLVISPFAKTIKKQIKNLSKIWNHNMGDVKFEVIKFPYAPAVSGKKEDKTHFHLLEKFNKMIFKKDFDLMMVGAGAASLPLVATAKKMGKIGVHLGGACQLFFGIKGQRWDNAERFKECQVYNSDLFIRPLKADLPTNSKIVENGCYW